MTASVNSFEDKFLGRIGNRLNRTATSLDVSSSPSPRAPSVTVWRREDQARVEAEAKQPVPVSAPKQRIPFSCPTPVVVAKPDPAIKAEAERKAAEKRRAAAEKAKAEHDAFVKAEEARISREQAAQAERVRLENERRAALEAQIAEKEAEAKRKAVASPESIATLVTNLGGTTKPKAEAPKTVVVEPPKPSTRKDRRGGVSLEELRARSAVPAVIAPPIRLSPSPKPVEVVPFVPKRSYAPKSEWQIAAEAQRAEHEAFIARIRNLCPTVVARIHRDAIGIRKTWSSIERMIELATQYSYNFKNEDMLPFIAACETAMAKIKK